ncbi:MAG: hypothetical protein Q7T01_02370 [bacterium]|nr:hypothetical protein [bacterium]
MHPHAETLFIIFLGELLAVATAVYGFRLPSRRFFALVTWLLGAIFVGVMIVSELTAHRQLTAILMVLGGAYIGSGFGHLAHAVHAALATPAPHPPRRIRAVPKAAFRQFQEADPPKRGST